MKGLVTTTVNCDDVRQTIAHLSPSDRATVNQFHRLFYHAGHTWPFTFYRGVNVLKFPTDLWVLQDILWDKKPGLVIETGTALGGSARFLADCLDRNGHGVVITIDLDTPPDETVIDHPRIWFVKGSSVQPDVVDYVTGRARATDGPVVVILDSDHREAHVTAELAAYAPLVTPGSFLVVEDTNVNGRPVLPDFGPGPGEAVDAFLAANPDFLRDPMAERYLLTMHPGGWLWRRQ